MKVIYNTLSLIAIILLNSCAQGDKKVDATPTTDGPNVIIDSGNIGGGGGPLDAGNGGGPLNPNVPAVNSNQSLVVPQQGKTAQVSSQNIQMTPAQMQQIQQQAIQNQQPQQAVVSQSAAHPPFSDVEFKKMQDDAQKRGVQLNPAHGQPGHRCDIYVGQPIDAKPVPALTKGAATTTAPTPAPQTVSVGTPQPVKTLPGMNPPHGEPGHRCDITVGQPLNSKPNTPAPSTGSKADSAKGGK